MTELRYKGFHIKNFKGIRDTYVDLIDGNSASVFPLVGLNESGKTTILEAMHSFSPDRATSRLVGGDEDSGVPIPDRVPRHLISTFTGDVSVIAHILLDERDKENVRSALVNKPLLISVAEIPDIVLIERHQTFKDGDYVGNYLTLRTNFDVKTGKQKKWRKPSFSETESIKFAIYGLTPNISYFPTFVFEFPEKIFLTKERRGDVNAFYRSVFQDILDRGGHGHSIEGSIVRRVRADTMIKPWLDFLSLWSRSDEKDKIQHVLDQASSTVTEIVFGRWNKIFGEEVKGKEIVISYDVVEGEVIDQKGVRNKTSSHDVAIKFSVRDGTRRFSVNDRSLGFRWFFSFMLFTQFRVSRGSAQPILFLFDEPASNLHAAAQQKLIESFPELTTGQNSLAYTTHSHYMIEPKWLEQTFIISNRSDEPLSSVIDATSLSDESLDVKATRYRNFVAKHQSKTNYFQPILDRLEVIPSKFDFGKKSIIVEGKSDYYILRYCVKLIKEKDLPLVPAFGAGTFGALLSLTVAWNLKTVFLLDGDKEGRKQQSNYRRDYLIPDERILLISDIDSSFIQIEDLLDDQARKSISEHYGISSQPTKGHILRFFQEKLASDDISSVSKHFRDKSKIIIKHLSLLVS